jgi:TPR repeat protein
MSTPKTKLAGLALITALCAGVMLGLTACADERARTGAETPLAEGDYNAERAAYKQGDYATAVREWRPLAKQGHAHAQFMLGVMYRKGQGVPQDDAESVRWSRKAAEPGGQDDDAHRSPAHMGFATR